MKKADPTADRFRSVDEVARIKDVIDIVNMATARHIVMRHTPFYERWWNALTGQKVAIAREITGTAEPKREATGRFDAAGNVVND